MGMGFIVGVLGVLILSHAVYTTVQYRTILKITEEEFSGPPMNVAMKRLQNKFYQILSLNRACLDPESVSARSSVVSNRTQSALASTRSNMSDFGEESNDEIRVVDRLIADIEDASAIAMIDLKLIVECMISNGYGKEVVQIYKMMRKSIVDEGIYKLDVEKEIPSKKIQKMDWEFLDIKIKSWLAAVNVVVNTLFHGEKILWGWGRGGVAGVAGDGGW